MPRKPWDPDDVASISARNRAAWAEQEAMRAATLEANIKRIGAFAASHIGTAEAIRTVTTSGGVDGHARQRGPANSARAMADAPERAGNARGAGVEPGPLTSSARVPRGTQPRKADAAHKANAASTGPIPCLVGKRTSKTIYPLVGLCRAAGLPEPIPEYKFHPQRKWRADYCWPIHKVIVEIEGGVWTQGRHTRGSGFVKDMEKYRAAALLGFFVLRYTPDDLAQAIVDLRVMFARSS